MEQKAGKIIQPGTKTYKGQAARVEEAILSSIEEFKQHPEKYPLEKYHNNGCFPVMAMG